ncbi:hypothetical protein [Halorubrum aethiopicum]|uniref:hypothetical protein n=1 Tax=Halorubrum aethiopicum TaxID=1758255 RepID=UPI00082C31B2|nr:hypothetical protein [Halorubrum aethiopicum]
MPIDPSQDARSSQRVGGSGDYDPIDPSPDPDPGGDYDDDQDASERVGGSGDPTDPPDPDPSPPDPPDVDLPSDDGGGGSADAPPDPEPDPPDVDPPSTGVDDVRADARESQRVRTQPSDVTVERAVEDAQASQVYQPSDETIETAVEDARASQRFQGMEPQGPSDLTVDRAVDDAEASARLGTVEPMDERSDSTIDAPLGTEIDTRITDDLTRGGVLSETPEGSSGLLPGEVFGIDVSEERFQDSSEAVDQAAASAFEESPPLTIAGSDAPDRVVTGAAEAATDIANLPGWVTTAETGAEIAANAPGEIVEEGAGAVGSTAVGVGAAAGAATVDSATESPLGFAGGAGLNVLSGAAAGRQLGRVGRAASDRVRTAGGARIDVDELASDDVVRNFETDGAEGTRFPGADDPDLYQRDPAAAVREQAGENTPPEIEDVFGEFAVDEGATIKKALDTEPEGPAVGRADTGFSSAPSELDGDFAYETPGSFFGPELSPNFLRVGDRERGLSIRPGFPDLGNKPTAVAARTDVENPDADTLDEFNQEMLDRAGDTTAVTKPADEVNPGEIEAVVPPGAQFQPLTRSRIRQAAEAPLDTAEDVGYDIGTRVGGGVSDASDVFGGALDAAEDVGYRAGTRVGETVSAAGDAAEGVGYRAGYQLGDATPDLPGVGDPASVFGGALDAAEDAGYRAGTRVGETVSAAGDAAERAGYDVGVRVGERVSAAGDAAEDVGYRAGTRVGETVSDIEDVGRGGARRLGEGVARAEDAAESVGYRAGYRLGERVSDARDVFGVDLGAPSVSAPATDAIPGAGGFGRVLPGTSGTVGDEVRGVARMAGIGADFYTEVGGRRVPIRTVAPDRGDASRAAPDADDIDGDSAATTAGGVDGDSVPTTAGRSGTLDELSERVTPASDDALPGVGASPANPATAPSSETVGSEAADAPPASSGGVGGDPTPLGPLPWESAAPASTADPTGAGPTGSADFAGEEPGSRGVDPRGSGAETASAGAGVAVSAGDPTDDPLIPADGVDAANSASSPLAAAPEDTIAPAFGLAPESDPIVGPPPGEPASPAPGGEPADPLLPGSPERPLPSSSPPSRGSGTPGGGYPGGSNPAGQSSPFGPPTSPPSQQRPRSDRGRPDRVEKRDPPVDERDPADTPFTNPILGVFGPPRSDGGRGDLDGEQRSLGGGLFGGI